jgi:hypothetical protein
MRKYSSAGKQVLEQMADKQKAVPKEADWVPLLELLIFSLSYQNAKTQKNQLIFCIVIGIILGFLWLVTML